MKNYIRITNVTKVNSLMGLIGEVSPLVSKVIYETMKTRYAAEWSEYCHDESEVAAAVFYDVALKYMQLGLDPHVVAGILDRHESAIRYMEVAQYDQLDTEEQQDQDAFWSRSDEQADFDAKLAMYANEY